MSWPETTVLEDALADEDGTVADVQDIRSITNQCSAVEGVITQMLFAHQTKKRFSRKPHRLVPEGTQIRQENSLRSQR